jgi:hypothetical protein
MISKPASRIAIGKYQKTLLAVLLNGNEIAPEYLNLSKAQERQWGSSYRKTWGRFVQRLEAAGYKLEAYRKQGGIVRVKLQMDDLERLIRQSIAKEEKEAKSHGINSNNPNN